MLLVDGVREVAVRRVKVVFVDEGRPNFPDPRNCATPGAANRTPSTATGTRTLPDCAFVRGKYLKHGHLRTTWMRVAVKTMDSADARIDPTLTTTYQVQDPGPALLFPHHHDHILTAPRTPRTAPRVDYCSISHRARPWSG